MSTSLTIVMPVFNESAHLSETTRALVEAASRSSFEADLVLVDDGSTDGSAETVRRSLGDRLRLTVVTQPNRGRFEARRAGLEVATGDWVLLLDGRVRLRPDSLAFVEGGLSAGETVWNGHVHVDIDGNPYGAFLNVLVELAWRDYFDDPRPVSFGPEEFDRFPKGTGCFLVPRALMTEALAAFRSGYAELRRANDDTPLIRWISTRTPIHLAPGFACDYRARATFGSFLRHSIHRGVVFLDGHGRPESRFFPAVVAFFPVSAVLALLSLRRPVLLPILATTSALAAAVVARRADRSPFETASFAALTPVYAAAHGLGMWRGLALLAQRRLGAAST